MPYFCVEMNDSSITRMAMSMSPSDTKGRRCMRACASDMRTIDSTWRTATGTPWPTCRVTSNSDGRQGNGKYEAEEEV